MDPIIAKTIELARIIMEDSRYISYRLATQKNDEDAELQELIGAFNMARMNLNQAASDTTPERKEVFQKEVTDLYAKIMASESMTDYQKAQNEVSAVVKQINAIVTGTIEGQNPEEIDIDESCGGNCSSCNGCH